MTRPQSPPLQPPSGATRTRNPPLIHLLYPSLHAGLLSYALPFSPVPGPSAFSLMLPRYTHAASTLRKKPMKRSLFSFAMLGLVLAAGATSLPAASQPEGENAVFSTIINDKGPAIVTLKFILKGGEQDQETETTGVVIDGTTGLVLASNTAFGGLAARFGGPVPTPSDIKILVGDDTVGLDAKFYARDTELGLAWVQLTTPPVKPLVAIDLANSAEATLGEPIYTISLMGKFFDRAVNIAEARVGALVKKPRPLYIPSIGFAGGEQGMPVFNAKGQVLGISTFILPDEDEVASVPGGMRSAMRGVTGGMILPAAEVIAATARAKETAASGGDPTAPADDAAPADPKADPKPDADAAPTTDPTQPKQ